jgi:ATP-binding cassette, subfamily B, bacterial
MHRQTRTPWPAPTQAMIAGASLDAGFDHADESEQTTEVQPQARVRSSYRDLLRRYRARLALLATTAGLGGLLEAFILIVLARIAFAVTDDTDTVELVGGVSVDMGVAFAVGAVTMLVTLGVQVLAAWQAADLGTLAVERMRKDLAEAFLDATWESQHGDRTGQLQELLTTFVRGGAQLIDATTRATIALCNLVALTIAVVFIDPLVALGLLLVVTALAWMVRPLRKLVRREAQSTADAGMRLATTLSEVSQLGMEMHVFNVQQPVRRRLDKLIAATTVSNRRVNFLNQFIPTIFTTAAFLALLGGLGVVSAVGVSDLASIGAVTLIMLRLLRSAQETQSNLAQINAAAPFLEQLDAELERYRRAKARDGGQSMTHVGTLRLVGVGFEYHTDVPVLRDVDATISPGEMIGIVGPSGSGKSTLVQLLLRLRPPTTGAVTAEGQDIRELAREQWSRRVTFVPQQAHLIAGTVADNIRFFRDEIPDERIEYAARLANLHDDVMGWEGGYERQVGEQGGQLSGGQQQRLVIARALVEQPDVLILDEPTSALDVRSEYLVRGALEALRDQMTVIIIAHRLSTLDNCDRIMVVMDGELKAFDTPDRLAETNEFYRDALAMSGIR